MKKLNLSFCENLIDSDFFLVNQNINNNTQNIEKVIRLGNKNLISLDILNLYKELKQLMRFIIFLRLKKRKKSKLILGFKEAQEIYLLTTYFKNYFVNYNLFVSKLDRIEEINKAQRLSVGLISFFSFSQNLEKIEKPLFIFDKNNNIKATNNNSLKLTYSTGISQLC